MTTPRYSRLELHPPLDAHDVAEPVQHATGEARTKSEIDAQMMLSCTIPFHSS